VVPVICGAFKKKKCCIDGDWDCSTSREPEECNFKGCKVREADKLRRLGDNYEAVEINRVRIEILN